MPDSPRCGADTRNGDQEPCQLPAGWGTDHPGEGRCKHHGGASSGAPAGNKNAVTTGEHEAIFYDTLDEEERELWHAVDADQLAQLDEQIRLINIRERRMMQRIRRIKREELTLVEETVDEGTAPTGGAAVSIEATQERRRHPIERIQKIEKALTRVQAEHRKLIREKYRILKEQPADHSDKLDQLLSRMNSMRENVDSYESPEMG